MHGRLRRIRLNISFLVMVFLLVALLLAVVFFFVFSFVRRILFVLLLCLFISLFFFYFLVGFNIMGRCKSFFFFCVVAIQTLLLCRLCFIQTKQKTITFFNVVRVIGISFSFTRFCSFILATHISYSFYLFLGIVWFIYWTSAFSRQLFNLRKISKQH